MGCSVSKVQLEAPSAELPTIERPPAANISEVEVSERPVDISEEEVSVAAAASTARKEVAASTARKEVAASTARKEVTWAKGSSDEEQHQRIGRPAAHRQRHRATCPETGVTTYKNHPSDELQADVKRGLGASLEAVRVACRASRPLTREDCERREIVVDDPFEGFKFKAAAPRAFAHLRELFGVSDAEYMQSICGEDDLIELSTPGKSGAVFFKTADGRFIIKTVSKVESKFLRSILFDYTGHIKDMAQSRRLRTLLPHFYDLVHIDTAQGRNIRLVVMNNLRPSGVCVHETYDLKGSSVGRWATEREKAAAGGCVLKDLDFERPLHVSRDDHELIREQLEADSAFLRRQGVVDYSLLCMLHFRHRRGHEPRLAQLTPDAAAAEGGDGNGDGDDDNDVKSSTSASTLRSGAMSHSDGSSLSGASTVQRDSSAASESFRRQVCNTDASIIKALHSGVASATASDGLVDESPPSLRGINGMLEATTADGEAIVVYCGVIDMLQQWRLRKMTEHTLKSAYYLRSSNGVSVVPPGAYTDRFVQQLLAKFRPHPDA